MQDPCAYWDKYLPVKLVCRILLSSMTIKQKVKQLVVSALLMVGFTTFIAMPVGAVSCDTAVETCCGGVPTAVISCTQTGGTGGEVTDTGAWGILLLAINILSAAVGLGAIGGIVYASIMYTTAGGSVEQTKKALMIITNVVIGVVAFAVMYSALNFLVPGGLFN